MSRTLSWVMPLESFFQFARSLLGPVSSSCTLELEPQPATRNSSRRTRKRCRTVGPSLWFVPRSHSDQGNRAELNLRRSPEVLLPGTQERNPAQTCFTSQIPEPYRPWGHKPASRYPKRC